MLEIKQISGPVSMYYLKPINDYIGMHGMPMFLLFGDMHDSYENMCSDCTCEDSKKCCHIIYDIEFLKKIEKLARPHRPIDFYIEFFEETTGIFASPLDDFREPEFQACYKRTLKNQSNCPAPGIRWHYSDIRKSYTKNNIENIFDSLQKFTRFCIELNKTLHYNGMHREDWLVTDKSSLKYKKHTGIDITKIKEIHKIIDLIEKLQHLKLDGFDYKDKLAEEIIEFLFTSEYPSLIHKQFKKQMKNSFWADKDYIIQIFSDCLTYSPYFKKYEFDSKTFDKLRKFDMKGDYRRMSEYLMIINGIFVDLYIILRAMKSIESPPSLCIAYLGNAHIMNIANILLNTGYYELAAEVKPKRDDSDNQNRCLPFDIFDDLKTSLKLYKGVKNSSSSSRKTKKTSSKSKS
jgi:hypothetical protein